MKKDKELWITANQAAEIISANSGRPVHPDYVRLLARQKPHLLRHKPLDGRTNVYLKEDVAKIKVKVRRSTYKREEPKPVEENRPIEEAA